MTLAVRPDEAEGQRRAEEALPPGFLNRIDDVIVFHQLTSDQIIEMVDLMIGRVEKQLKAKDIDLELTDKAKSLLAKRGFDPVLGARPLRRTIQREIEDQLSEKISSTRSPGPDRRRRRRGLGRRGRRRRCEVHLHRFTQAAQGPRRPGRADRGRRRQRRSGLSSPKPISARHL